MAKENKQATGCPRLGGLLGLGRLSSPGSLDSQAWRFPDAEGLREKKGPACPG